ncbi:transcription termination factor NusA [Weissella koreensis]|uniref:Transcription termination/antitermination protein NusA n=1 Tax=Weissella koreensis TaxID=165096 RepID=A0A7H1MMX5_9LACO|nr:transcription termination factor NusA [Weissella koreensis]AVH75607.1 transcription termination/antitermination protein NusA [Weissella koreensis]EJF34594.1 transcription elongation factor [Weissella koreensis KCTC 3621]QGN20830.1 transcription termination/antitermination protein NusA [Weissella koreensis]QNT64811.1 transcription termination/antitermination protein NusA [Weissella koreensis]
MSKEIVAALDALETERGIQSEVLIDAIEVALAKAYEENYDDATNVEVNFDRKKGNIKVYQIKTVVSEEELENHNLQISLEEAHKLHKDYEIGDEIKFEVTPGDFGRLAAGKAKQIIIQKVREAERMKVYNEYKDDLDEVITGEVAYQDNRYLYVTLPGGKEAAMKTQDQMTNESYRNGDLIKVLLTEVEQETKRGPQIFVSRTAPNLVKRLFEAEVPEVQDGTVEIKAIAREAGDRSKVAVVSYNENLDAVGTMIGQRGARVQTVISELSGENLDIIQWSEDPTEFIVNALRTTDKAEVLEVIFDPSNDRGVTVLVPDDQLSLFIGKRGQNARLAAKLTNFSIDIKPEAQRDVVYAEMEEKVGTVGTKPTMNEAEKAFEELDLN